MERKRRKPIPQDGPDRFPTDWSRDGKYVLYERGADLWFVTIPEFQRHAVSQSEFHSEERPFLAGWQVGRILLQ